MYLTRIGEILSILNDSTQEVDIYCAWEDECRTQSGVGPISVGTGSAVMAVASSSLTTIIPGDKPQGTIRKILSLNLKAPIANTVSVTARLRLTVPNTPNAGTTTIDLMSVPLAPGDNRIYTLGVGWQFIPASGVNPSTADLVQQFITELRNQTPAGDLV